ncbi:hypothetical protein [Clostridium sp.]|uniref:hypothetical protein n=1 Tax=Clostridium sp. TaxID=1506 RepID=UPI00262B80F6|nr:hypothetical protein [Clostridium sp.]
MKCITISGSAGHGKDTFANNLKKHLEISNHKVCIFHYADYIKMIAKEIYEWDGNKDFKGRSILQKLGDNIRSKDKMIIVNELVKVLEIVENDFDIALIPDSRFPIEIDAIKDKWETICVHINRINYMNNLTDEQKKHITETSLDTYTYDISYDIEENIFNDYSKELLNKLKLL